MVSRIFVFLWTVLVLSPAYAGTIPQSLGDQIERVAELLRDGYAAEYPDARMMQRTRADDDRPVTLVVFTIEGFGGGNNHTQYLAAFEHEAGPGEREHYRLMDVIPVGGKGWRTVEDLNVRTVLDPNQKETIFLQKVLFIGPNDAMSSPTVERTVRIVLKEERLTELPPSNASTNVPR